MTSRRGTVPTLPMVRQVIPRLRMLLATQAAVRPMVHQEPGVGTVVPKPMHLLAKHPGALKDMVLQETNTALVPDTMTKTATLVMVIVVIAQMCLLAESLMTSTEAVLMLPVMMGTAPAGLVVRV